jgi:hypothetical protein
MKFYREWLMQDSWLRVAVLLLCIGLGGLAQVVLELGGR